MAGTGAAVTGAAREIGEDMAAFEVMDGEVVTALAVPLGTSVLGSVFRFTVASTPDTSAGIILTLDTIHTAPTHMGGTHMVDITGATTSTVDTRTEAIPAMFIGAAPGATAMLLWSREFNNDWPGPVFIAVPSMACSEIALDTLSAFTNASTDYRRTGELIRVFSRRWGSPEYSADCATVLARSALGKSMQG